MNAEDKFRSITKERRNAKRYRLKDNCFMARVSKSENILGVILDISREGLAFSYTSDSLRIEESFKLDILKKNDTVCLQNIGYQNMNDFEMDNDLIIRTNIIRRRGIKFVNLNSNQKFDLANLIKDSEGDN